MHFLLLATDTLEFANLLDWKSLIRYGVRMLVALVLGAVVGYERASAGKEAGVRTHMLVTLASALLVMIPQALGFDSAALSRVIQGILAGIGFIGGGVIVKLAAEKEVIGLTTAAGIWLATAVGIATGFGHFGLALLATVAALVIMGVATIRDTTDHT